MSNQRIEVEATIANESYPTKMSINPDDFVATTILREYVYGKYGTTTICLSKDDYEKVLNNKSFNN